MFVSLFLSFTRADCALTGPPNYDGGVRGEDTSPLLSSLLFWIHFTIVDLNLTEEKARGRRKKKEKRARQLTDNWRAGQGGVTDDAGRGGGGGGGGAGGELHD